MEQEGQFRKQIANASGLSLNEVNIVGSAQIGFSIKPQARLSVMDHKFIETGKIRDRSDIDVAVVSPRFFDQVHDDLRNFTSGFKKHWEFNAYYPDAGRMSRFEVKRADFQFYQYLARGWLRPDFAPDDFQFSFNHVLDEWKVKLNRKVAVGIYKEWKFLKDYQASAFDQLRELAIKGQL